MNSVTLILLMTILTNVGAVIVSVEQGLLRGEQKWTITGDTFYHSFKGVPYATPPTGNMRFKAPHPPLSWNGIRNATVHGSVCPQVGILVKEYTGSEDCLFLNVYTPSLYKLLPVMIFIHGGGYRTGSGNDDYYGPDFLLDENVVVVTFNYRLDALGFLNLETKEVPGNAGMKDQVAALRWVQRNIRKFGGDPNNVTIFGQSAGGDSCWLHALSSMSKGLFCRLIAMSGVPTNDFAVEFEPKRRALVLGRSLGVYTSNTKELYNFFQNVPARQLLDTNSSVLAIEDYILYASTIFYFVPNVEKDFGQERFLTEIPEVSVRNGRINGIDIILGYTTAEGLDAISLMEQPPTIENYERYREAFVPRSILYQITPNLTLELGDIIRRYYSCSQAFSVKTIPEFVKYNTDVFNYQILRFTAMLSNFKNKIYLYVFSFISERNVLSIPGFKYGIYGVAHTDDLMYIFNANEYQLPLDKNATSFKVIRSTCKLWTNFAKVGNPTPDLMLDAKWPKYNSVSKRYLDIGEKLTVGSEPNKCMLEFWKSIYKRAGLRF